MAALALPAVAQTVEPLPFGDMNRWETRVIKESRLLGGNEKTLYEIAPVKTVTGDIAYTPQGGSPWATSNVLAHVSGLTKTSCAVVPEQRAAGNKAAKLMTIIERCRALGLINVDVLVGGSIFLGEMIEPITSTENPYSHMVMGMPYTRRPQALVFDYKVDMPSTDTRTYSSGFGKKKTLPGHDSADVFIILQRRWEDKDGNLYAKRVGTGRERFSQGTTQWVNGHKLTVNYGDITSQPYYKAYMGLLDGDKAYYARNSHGQIVPVHEVGWDAPDATPTHLLIMASSASGTAYEGTVGLNFYIDNVGLQF